MPYSRMLIGKQPAIKHPLNPRAGYAPGVHEEYFAKKILKQRITTWNLFSQQLITILFRISKPASRDVQRVFSMWRFRIGRRRCQQRNPAGRVTGLSGQTDRRTDRQTDRQSQ